MTNKETVDPRALLEGTTPGPWIVNPFRAQVDCQALIEKGGLLPVAQMLWPTDERSEDETDANAWLIAAAPQLALTCISQEERIAEAREAFEAIKEYLDRDETQLAWEAANTALTNTGEVR